MIDCHPICSEHVFRIYHFMNCPKAFVSQNITLVLVYLSSLYRATDKRKIPHSGALLEPGEFWQMCRSILLMKLIVICWCVMITYFKINEYQFASVNFEKAVFFFICTDWTNVKCWKISHVILFKKIIKCKKWWFAVFKKDFCGTCDFSLALALITWEEIK